MCDHSGPLNAVTTSRYTGAASFARPFEQVHNVLQPTYESVAAVAAMLSCLGATTNATVFQDTGVPDVRHGRRCGTDLEQVAAEIRDIDFRPATSIEEGIRKFAAWYRGFYNA